MKIKEWLKSIKKYRIKLTILLSQKMMAEAIMMVNT